MDVSVDIRLKPAQAFRMDRDVSEDHIVQNPDTVDFFKEWQVILGSEDVVVTPDQPFVPVASPNRSDRLPFHGHISQMIYVRRRADYGIPPVDHVLIHFFHAGKISERRPVGLLEI